VRVGLHAGVRPASQMDEIISHIQSSQAPFVFLIADPNDNLYLDFLNTSLPPGLHSHTIVNDEDWVYTLINPYFSLPADVSKVIFILYTDGRHGYSPNYVSSVSREGEKYRNWKQIFKPILEGDNIKFL